MSLGLVFWILMLLWLVLWLWDWRSPTGWWSPYGSNLFLFILFLILGWHSFGAPVHP